MSKHGRELKYPCTLSCVFRHVILFLRIPFIFLNKAKPRLSRIITEGKPSYWEGALAPEIHLSLGDSLLLLSLKSHIKKNNKINPPNLSLLLINTCPGSARLAMGELGGGRISLLVGPAGPHSLNACSPDVCLSLILLKESACFLTGLC